MGGSFVVAVSAISAILAFASPGIAMLVAGSTVRYAPYSYAFGLTSCALWISVGLHDHRTALFRLSLVGVVAYAAYLVAYLRKAEAADARRRCLLRYVGGGSVGVLLVGVVLRFFASNAAYNWFCSTVACLTSLAPLWNLPAVFRTRSTDSMPSVIVAALGLTNAIVSTVRNTAGAEAIDRSIAVPSGVALFSTLVQVVLHMVCCCLPRPPVGEPAIDPRPLLGNQTDDAESGHEHDASATVDGRQLPNNHTASETRVDVATLEELALDKNETIEIENDMLPQDGQHGQEEVDHNDDKIVDSTNPQLTQDVQEEVGHHDDDKIVDGDNLPLPQDGQEEVGHHDDGKIVDGNSLPQPQDGQEKNDDSQVVAVHHEEKVFIDMVELKPANVVPSEETSTSSVYQVHPTMPQQQEKA